MVHHQGQFPLQRFVTTPISFGQDAGGNRHSPRGRMPEGSFCALKDRLSDNRTPGVLGLTGQFEDLVWINNSGATGTGHAADVGCLRGPVNQFAWDTSRKRSKRESSLHRFRGASRQPRTNAVFLGCR